MGKDALDKGNLKYWAKVIPIKSGMTDDQKYKVWNNEGQAFFLRISDINRYPDLLEEAKLIDAFRQKGLPVAKVESVDYCENDKQCFLLLHWLNGNTLDTVLPTQSEKKQYEIGLKAGKHLYKLHHTPLDIKEPFAHRNLKTKKNNEFNHYINSHLRAENDELIVKYIKENIDLIGQGPNVIEHSDYHPGNLILRDDGSLAIIDFNGSHQGDAYEEFYKLELFVLPQSKPYCLGQIHGYFQGEPPEAFWHYHRLYTALAALYGIRWASDYKSDQALKREKKRLKRIRNDYDDFKRLKPKWYILSKDIQY